MIADPVLVRADEIAGYRLSGRRPVRYNLHESPPKCALGVALSAPGEGWFTAVLWLSKLTALEQRRLKLAARPRTA